MNTKLEKWLSALAVLALVAFSPPAATAAEWEYERDEGLHQEEWYDPSDWFDDDAGIDYESDWYDYTYGYDYYDPGVNGVHRYYGGDDYYDYNYYEDLYDYDFYNELYDYGNYDYYTDTWYEDDFDWYGDNDDIYDFGYLDGYDYLDGPEVQQIEGTVKELKEVQLAGLDERNLLARLETPEGRTIRVDLGLLNESRRSRVNEGDRITVYGTEGSLNERPLFMALSIQTKTGDEKVKRASDQNLKKIKAEVLSTRTAGFQEQKVPDQVFARIRLPQGATTIINLGSAKDLPEDMKLEDKKITFLARPIEIAGKSALVAEEIRVDGRTIQIDRTIVPNAQAQPAEPGSKKTS